MSKLVIARSTNTLFNYRPLLQRFNYSPLPVRPRNRKSNRITRNEDVIKVKEDVNPTVAPMWPSTPPPPMGQYAWTDYESLPRNETRKKTTPIVVQVAKDGQGVIRPEHPAAELLSQSALVVVRQLEMMNLFIGFEQANRYRILNPTGETVGYLAEEERGLGGTLLRQLVGTHRPFSASILNRYGQEILRIRRPFSFINSRAFVEAPPSDGSDGPNEVVGVVRQEFHLWRRKYDLFTRSSTSNTREEEEEEEEEEYEQFAKIDAGFLSWDFYTQDREARLTGSVTRNFTGFAREIFTDTGQYVIRFDAVQSQVDLLSTPDPSLNNLPSTQVNSTGLTLDQRAVMLATAVSIDFDYFSRSHRGGLMPPIFFGGGGSSDDI